MQPCGIVACQTIMNSHQHIPNCCLSHIYSSCKYKQQLQPCGIIACHMQIGNNEFLSTYPELLPVTGWQHGILINRCLSQVGYTEFLSIVALPVPGWQHWILINHCLSQGGNTEFSSIEPPRINYIWNFRVFSFIHSLLDVHHIFTGCCQGEKVTFLILGNISCTFNLPHAVSSARRTFSVTGRAVWRVTYTHPGRRATWVSGHVTDLCTFIIFLPQHWTD